MTLGEALTITRRLKPNAFASSDLIRWLSELDGTVKREIFDTHCGEEVPFSGYSEDTPEDTVLLIPSPYDKVYLFYLESKIDYQNAEYASYNNSAAMFNEAYDSFAKRYHSRHLPKSRIRLKVF